MLRASALDKTCTNKDFYRTVFPTKLDKLKGTSLGQSMVIEEDLSPRVKTASQTMGGARIDRKIKVGELSALKTNSSMKARTSLHSPPEIQEMLESIGIVTPQETPR